MYLGYVREGELDVDDLDVAGGIDAALHVDDVGVLETSHDWQNGAGVTAWTG